jgi:hypothetical protein
MNRPDLTQTSLDGLYRILDLSADSAQDWSDDELAAVLDCQLSAALADDLPTALDVDAQEINSLAESVEPAVKTYRQLLDHPQPPLGLLDLVKSFAKQTRDRDDQPLPQPVCSLLYYAVLSAAWVAHGRRLTSLKDEELRHGLDWALDQLWVTASLRGLLERAKKTLDHPTESK